MPSFEDLDWRGLERVSQEQFAELERVDREAWKQELQSHDELFGKLGKRLPNALETQLGQLHQNLA
jgi:phosphoenolpyruvate carboxykinase (GTP)